ILGGTDVWVEAPIPEGMSDFSGTSFVEIEDPQGSAAPLAFPLSDAVRRIGVTQDGDLTRITATLVDLSGNENPEERVLEKRPFFATSTSPVFTPASPEQAVTHVVVVPGLDSG